MIIILTLFSSKTMRIQKKNCAIFAYTQRWIVTAQDRWAVTELQNWTLNLTAEPLKSDLIDLAIFLSRPTEIAPDHKQKMLWKQKHAKFAPLPLCVPRFTSRSCRDFRSIILWIRSTLSYTTRLNTLNQELVLISLTVSDVHATGEHASGWQSSVTIACLNQTDSSQHTQVSTAPYSGRDWLNSKSCLIDWLPQSFLLVTSRFCVCLVYYVIAKCDCRKRETRVRILMWFRPYWKK